MAEHAIEVEGLVREYKKGPRAVDGVDLYVEKGEIYGFLGPNGAGKSTMVKMLVTLLPPSGGRATVGGFDIATQGDQVRRIIGVALQEAALDPLLTGREHLYLQAGLNGFPKKDAKERGVTLLERVGLTGAGDRKIGTYSGGMRRRLDLALALVHSPSIIFLDEPTTGLDPHSRAALSEEVRRLSRDEGMTIFLTTQYLEEADVLARAGRDHRPRQDRRGGHAPGAEGADRRLHPRGHSGARERQASVGGRSQRFGELVPAAGENGASASGSASPEEGPSPTSCARSTSRESRSPTSRSASRPWTTSSSPRPDGRSKPRRRGARARRRGRGRRDRARGGAAQGRGRPEPDREAPDGDA